MPARLPKRTIPRIAAIVERSLPNPDRPRLPDENMERRLEPTERKTAICYAGLDSLIEETWRVVEELRRENAVEEAAPEPLDV